MLWDESAANRKAPCVVPSSQLPLFVFFLCHSAPTAILCVHPTIHPIIADRTTLPHVIPWQGAASRSLHRARGSTTSADTSGAHDADLHPPHSRVSSFDSYPASAAPASRLSPARCTWQDFLQTNVPAHCPQHQMKPARPD